MDRSVLVSIASITVSLVTLAFVSRHERNKTRALYDALEKEKKKSRAERNGRVSAEKLLRRHPKEIELSGIRAIGHVKSCFPDRRGTPRQPLICPSTRACICFDNDVPPAALEGLDGFSHCWVIFKFHDNTNAHRVGRNKRSKGPKKPTFRAKVAPPQLGGKRVGVLSTRTPHRPNPLGLSVVQIESVDLKKRTVHIRGADILDGSPVFDIKPYLSFDAVTEARVPGEYTHNVDIRFRPKRVVFSKDADAALQRLSGRTRFYKGDSVALQKAVSECISLDIRAVHQGRGHATGSNKYHMRFDKLNFIFETHESEVIVTDIVPLRATN